MTWNVEVDGHRCIASGMCAGIAPSVFELGDHHARALVDTVEPDELVVYAAESCPANAITVTEAGQVVAP